MIWSEAEKYLINDDVTKNFLEKVGDIEDIRTPSEYENIWKDISFLVQLKKAKSHSLSPEDTKKCLSQLIKRPYYLARLIEQFDAENILEVGTAEGLQFYSFAESVSERGKGHIWSCDIFDKRNEKYAQKHKDITTFCLGTSKELAAQMDEKIDLFYIDASHQAGAVLEDVGNLKNLQSENPIWIFDDFDVRFGCYEDIKEICKKSGRFKIYRVGNAASGNPNHQVIVYGKL
jgi:hypothetical protein